MTIEFYDLDAMPNFILSERRRLGMSQSELAKKSLISTRSISEIETGVRPLTLYSIERLGKVFDFTIKMGIVR